MMIQRIRQITVNIPINYTDSQLKREIYEYTEHTTL